MCLDSGAEICYSIIRDILYFDSRISLHRKQPKVNQESEVPLKQSIYKTYDELPLFLNAETVAKVLGVSPSSGYELMHQPDFPTLRVGNRMVVPKEQFIRWVEKQLGGVK